MNVQKSWMSFSGVIKTLVFFLLATTVIHAEPERVDSSKVPVYEVHVTIDPAGSTLIGRAIYTAPESRVYEFETNGIIIDGQDVSADNSVFRLNAEKNKSVEFSFHLSNNSDSNYFQNDGVHLTGYWFPAPRIPSIIKIKASLPANFLAVSEAENTTREEVSGNAVFTFNFPYPRYHASLIASSKFITHTDSTGDVQIEAYFFEEDEALTDGYVNDARRYIKRYEKRIAPFPYRRFAIVESFIQTGQSMPTFSVFGSHVLNLPFIRDTSLGHEVLHQWFGNYVTPVVEKGNWSEGLVTYLADHMFRADLGEGRDYRKEILSDYESYTAGTETLTLRNFRYRNDRITQTVGYGKTALVFHMIRRKIGDKAFYNGLRNILELFPHKNASWDDMIASFSRESNSDLKTFIDPWLDRPGLPSITIKDTLLEKNKNDYSLKFRLEQTGPVFPLTVPVVISKYGQGRIINVELSQASRNISLTLPYRPAEITVDPYYDLARRLSPAEIPPALSRLLEEKHIIFVVSDELKKAYEPLAMLLHGSDVAIISPEELNAVHARNSSIIFADSSNSALSPVYDFTPVNKSSTFSFQIRKNPWNPERVAALIQSKSKNDSLAILRRLPHYGRYSAVDFEGRSVLQKTRAFSENGLRVYPASKAVSVHDNLDFFIEEIADESIKEHIVFIGEQHNLFSHHQIQLDIIKQMYAKNPELIIGMEMFSRSYQKYIDAFIDGKIDEREFLTETEYFKNWGFDYNLYKPILDFAREFHLPVVALNIDRSLIREVSRNGIHSLDKEQSSRLKGPMDFSDTGYRQFLEEIFLRHGSGQGIDPIRFERFLQSQIIWDESMAQATLQALETHPGYSMAVIAGSGHIRFGRGIPDRVYRDIGFRGIRVVMDDVEKPGVADYNIFPGKMQYREAPKLGVMIQEEPDGMFVRNVDNDSPAHMAGILAGDYIVNMGGHPVKTMNDVKIELHFALMDKPFLLTVRRNGKTVDLKVQFP